jgi:enoyl-CoA hydratase/carnithine racemase
VALHLDTTGLLDVLTTPASAGELSSAHGTAAVVVDLDATDLGTAAQHRLRALPCVTVACHGGRPPSSGRWFDVLLGPEDEALADDLVAAIEAHPLASTALAVLLRGGESRDIDDGLAAESAVYSLLQAGPEFAAWRAARPAPRARREAGPAVLVGRDAATLHITLNRPARHNAFDVAMRDELCGALELVAADGTIERVVLDGTGPSFCSGGDLDEFGSFPDPATAHVVRLTRSAARLLSGIAERTEVHLHGACMGAGIELAAFAGRVIALPDSAIALPELSLGLIPGAGGTVSLPRRIGRHRTALLALSGMRLDAATALSWGLVDEITSSAAGAEG